jgi:hypothetical protein
MDVRHPLVARAGLEDLEADYQVESVASPSGVTHLTFTRGGR